MKKFKMLIVAMITISAYSEQDINTWINNNSVTKSVYGHIRSKEKRCKDLQAVERRITFSKEKISC